MKKLTIFLLVISMLLAVPHETADAYDEPYVRVGLRYDSTVMSSANLANEVGSGYYFGFFEGNNFTGLGGTYEEKITIVKDKNMYFSGGVYYETSQPSSSVIGAYHIDLGRSFSTYEEAQNAAAEVTSNGTPSFPAYISGEYRVRVGNFSTEADANARKTSIGLSSAPVVGGSATCFTVTATSDGRILYEYDMGTKVFAVMPAGSAQSVTWFRGYKYNGAFEYRRNDGNDLTVINVVKIGDYPKGVIPYEMNPEWPMEALKAQAVCASSYAAYNKNKHSSKGFDVCNTTDCQVYRGLNTATEASNAACEAVRGVGIYYNGKICNAVYHSSNGGATENAENVWGTKTPYLISVTDGFENLASANNGIWSYTYTGEELSWLLTEKGYPIGKVTKAYVDEYTAAGNVYRVVFIDASGKKLVFEKESARTILYSETLKKYANSQRYTISTGSIELYVNSSSGKLSAGSGTAVIGAGGKTGTLKNGDEVYIKSASGTTKLQKTSAEGFVVSGTGWGHNVGMSQYGAKGMAENGYTYDQIIRYYYTGIELLNIN
ncbi:MAG: SpoIID/LytB domain-containing protein [Oscillospiraceae bacterium]|jgi:stage II sporulation protein D|nr:SpoIID/LytB domain-containing protein [Oscillospiraceae bacterium]